MSEPIVSKRCFRCKTYKTFSEFNKNRSSKDGYQSQCKECQKKTDRKYASTERGKEVARKSAAKHRNTIKRQEYDYHYHRSEKNKRIQKRYANTKAGKISRKKAAKQNARKFPEKNRARHAVKYAVRKGRLPRIRTQKCFLCDRQAYMYHHHKGYAEKHRLNVMPLCYECHKFIHFCLNVH